MPLVLRPLLVTALAASLIAVASPAEAHHRPNFYCSDSGDMCQSTRKVDGVRKLGILLAARYFTIFHLCVRYPDGVKWCAPYRIRAHDDGTYGRDVNWFKQWGGRQPGRYTVSWWRDDQRIGWRLGFHVRSALSSSSWTAISSARKKSCRPASKGSWAASR